MWHWIARKDIETVYQNIYQHILYVSYTFYYANVRNRPNEFQWLDFFGWFRSVPNDFDVFCCGKTPTSFQRADPFWLVVGLAETFAVAFWYFIFGRFKQNVEWIVARNARTWDQFEWFEIFKLLMMGCLTSISCTKLHHPKLPHFLSALVFPGRKNPPRLWSPSSRPSFSAAEEGFRGWVSDESFHVFFPSLVVFAWFPFLRTFLSSVFFGSLDNEHRLPDIQKKQGVVSVLRNRSQLVMWQ